MSAIAHILSDSKTITVFARLFFYGSEATTEGLHHILDEINTMWNKPRAQVLLNETVYAVQFDIQGVIVNLNDVPMMATYNRDFANNFIRIETTNRLERSMMGMGLGDNSGHWLSTDQLGHSTTAAHEFGHALGLPHPKKLDYRGENLPPPIMAPRGTLVDAPFQWNPQATPGEPGSTMNPRYREVHASEIAEVFHPFLSHSSSRLQLGKISNTVYDQVGNPLVLA